MKRITLALALFIGSNGLMNAQFVQSSGTDAGVRTTDVHRQITSQGVVNPIKAGKKATKDNSDLARSVVAPSRVSYPLNEGDTAIENLTNSQYPSIYGSRNFEGENRQHFTAVERQLSDTYIVSQKTENRYSQAIILTEGFDDITTLSGAGFSFVNVSDVVGSTNWFQGNETVFPSHSGAPSSYIGANFNNSSGSSINNFMITPVLNLKNGDEITFWSRTASGSIWPDRLEVRIDPTGANTNPTGPSGVGSYTELLLSINPTLATGGYPEVWTKFTATISGLTGSVDTRVAFRYWVTDAANNSNYIGIDSLTIADEPVVGTFPDPYCAVVYGTVEPITLVDVAGISNRSSAVVNGSPAHEDFTAIFGNMEEGESYAIALEGNTDGNFTCTFTVFIDWNQDGVFDNASERYQIGTIVGSTGVDGMQATSTITVPAGVAEGPTRMRVMKRFGSTYSTDGCTGTSWGQAEDYTIMVTAGGDPIDDSCNQEHAVVGDANGGSGSSQDSDFKSAADIVVNAGENFIIDTIEVPFLTFAPEDAPISATVVYYEDAGGMPSTEIGRETVVPTVLSSGPWVNPIAYEFITELVMTPFTFAGDENVDTTYWIEVSMGTATAQQTVFWAYTDGAGLEGGPLAQFNAANGFWSIPEATREAIYNFSGICEEIGDPIDDSCNQEHAVVGDADGGSGSSQNSDFKSAADIVVNAGENFIMDAILVPFLTLAPEDAPISATVVYYEDAGGLPSAEIGRETVVPTILSSGPWVNPIAYEFITELVMTPFTFAGDENVDTTYWIEVSMGTATAQQTVFWAYTDGAGLEGGPLAQFNAANGFWSIPEATREAIYNFSGICEEIDPTIGVSSELFEGFTYYPNPTNGMLNLKAQQNIQTIEVFNMLGQKVVTSNIGATSTEIDLSGLATGTYVMRVAIDGQIGTYKVIKN